MSHRNAALSPVGRLKLARLIVDDGWPIARAAERFQVSWPTAKRWADRYRQLGAAGMADRSSRPHRQPNRTSQPLIRKVVHMRWKHKLGPVAIGDKVKEGSIVLVVEAEGAAAAAPSAPAAARARHRAGRTGRGRPVGGLDVWVVPAATYSPTGLPLQYHRRWRA